MLPSDYSLRTVGHQAHIVNASLELALKRMLQLQRSKVNYEEMTVVAAQISLVGTMVCKGRENSKALRVECELVLQRVQVNHVETVIFALQEEGVFSGPF